MESLFEVNAELNKDIYKESGHIQVKRKKSFSIIFICSILLLLLFPISLLMKDVLLEMLAGFLGVYFFLLALFYEDMIASNSAKNNNPVLGKFMTYSFYDSGMTEGNSVISSSVKYEVIQNVLETNNLFLLYIKVTSKNSG